MAELEDGKGTLLEESIKEARKVQNWRIRPTLESRVANESVSKSAMCFWGLCRATIPGARPLPLNTYRRTFRNIDASGQGYEEHMTNQGKGQVLSVLQNGWRNRRSCEFHATGSALLSTKLRSMRCVVARIS